MGILSGTRFFFGRPRRGMRAAVVYSARAHPPVKEGIALTNIYAASSKGNFCLIADFQSYTLLMRMNLRRERERARGKFDESSQARACNQRASEQASALVAVKLVKLIFK